MMPKPLPMEFRCDVVAVGRKQEAPLAPIARDFGISESCLSRWLRMADRDDGVPEPASAGQDTASGSR
jgi:transposase